MKKLFLFFGIVVGFLISPVFATGGELEVGISRYQGFIPKNGISIPFLTLEMTAKEADVLVDEFNVEQRGLSAPTDFGRIWGMVDGRRSYNSSVLHDGVARIRFKRTLVIPEGETKIVKVLGNMRSNFGTGRTVYFLLGRVDSTADRVLTFSPETKERVEPVRKRKSKARFRIRCKDGKCVRIRKK